jgi:hypothetical protein
MVHHDVAHGSFFILLALTFSPDFVQVWRIAKAALAKVQEKYLIRAFVATLDNYVSGLDVEVDEVVLSDLADYLNRLLTHRRPVWLKHLRYDIIQGESRYAFHMNGSDFSVFGESFVSSCFGVLRANRTSAEIVGT